MFVLIQNYNKDWTIIVFSLSKTIQWIAMLEFALKEVSGEIFISTDRVRENASEFQQSFEEEIRRVMIHGLLHLCGYNDKTIKEKSLMSW